MLEWTCHWCGHVNRAGKNGLPRATCAQCNTADFARYSAEFQRDADEYNEEMSIGGLPHNREDW